MSYKCLIDRYLFNKQCKAETLTFPNHRRRRKLRNPASLRLLSERESPVCFVGGHTMRGRPKYLLIALFIADRWCWRSSIRVISMCLGKNESAFHFIHFLSLSSGEVLRFDCVQIYEHTFRKITRVISHVYLNFTSHQSAFLKCNHFLCYRRKSDANHSRTFYHGRVYGITIQTWQSY